LVAVLREKDDIRIFILYLLRNIGYPLSYYDLHDVVTQDGYVNSFDCTECIYDLVEKGNLLRTEENGKEMFAITDQGCLVADELKSRLLHTIREKSLRSAFRFMDFKKKGSRVICKVQPNMDTTYEITCGVVERERELMMITVHVDNDATKERILHNFDERPESVYRGMMALLTGEMNYLFEDAD